MEIFNFNLNYKIEDKKEAIIVLGSFYTFHKGHQKLFQQASKKAKETGKRLIVMLYPNFDQKFNLVRKSLVPLETRLKLLEQYNVDYAMIFDPSSENYRISLESFLLFLKDNLSVEEVFVGENFTFRKKNVDDFIVLKKYFKLSIVELERINNQIISTTLGETLLHEKALEDFKKITGFNYFYEGVVMPGKLLGTKHNTPTANVKVNPGLLYPPEGIYVSLISFDHKKYYSVTSISNNPTFNEKQIVFETHILKFDSNIYGKTVVVELLKFIRAPIKFNSIKDLYKEIENDKLITKKYFKLI